MQKIVFVLAFSSCATHGRRVPRTSEHMSDSLSEEHKLLRHRGLHSAGLEQLRSLAERESLSKTGPSLKMNPSNSLMRLLCQLSPAAGWQSAAAGHSHRVAMGKPTSSFAGSPLAPSRSNVRLSAAVEKDESAEDDAAAAVLDILPKVAGASVVGAALLHAPAFANFASQWQEIGASGVSGDDFWAPLQFWGFFAAMHPLLQPAIWIGEVLHGSPGPQLADVMPISFILLNVVVLGALSTFAELRTSLNLGLFALFIHFIGCGLEGSKDLSDYNLALDDKIKGCPTYEEVKQSSMKDFDVNKYTGRWYEHGFHDWTQFGDVYDTTLDIELSKDGSRWLDDFALRGPSPQAAPLSWDKSPVANGAHYFLYGKLNKDTPGVLQESGFGVTFPNYIVDVQKDADGKYSEAIQFQCLERGGVRIFEGINFLSRDSEMTPAARAAMFERAKIAGIAPYGATPEQMHTVLHREPGSELIVNSWQRLWSSIGFDKLLGLVESSTHSAFEDTRGLGS